VQASLLSGQEARKSTLRKMYSIKKVTFDTIVDVSTDLFSTTIVPAQILKAASSNSGVRVSGANTGTLSTQTLQYLIGLTEQLITVTTETDTITINQAVATNPETAQLATVFEFDIYLNGQYLDKATYSWTPASTQTIIFDTAVLGTTLQTDDIIVVKGRWA
jgi:archaellum component FlaF (FlaF/FlaG flagellin family)